MRSVLAPILTPTLTPSLTLILTSILAASLPLAALADSCGVDDAAVEAAIARLEPGYPGVLSDISCDLPTVPAHKIMCAAAESPEDLLWRMGRLNDLAWAFAVENATKIRYDIANPTEPNPGLIATRDDCTDAACICAVLIEDTNASLGGTSPYPQ